MKLLLDTRVFLWAQTDPERLGPHRGTLQDAANELLLSAASSWEIAIKFALGRLPLPEPPASYVPARAAASGCTLVGIGHPETLAVADLPQLHRDPFDRLLVAQAITTGATLVTADPLVAQYDVATLVV